MERRAGTGRGQAHTSQPGFCSIGTKLILYSIPSQAVGYKKAMQMAKAAIDVPLDSRQAFGKELFE